MNTTLLKKIVKTFQQQLHFPIMPDRFNSWYDPEYLPDKQRIRGKLINDKHVTF